MMCDFTFNILETTVLRNRVFRHKGNFTDKKSPDSRRIFQFWGQNVYQSLFLSCAFCSSFARLLYAKRLWLLQIARQASASTSCLWRFWRRAADVLIIGIGEHSAQYASPIKPGHRWVYWQSGACCEYRIGLARYQALVYYNLLACTPRPAPSIPEKVSTVNTTSLLVSNKLTDET